MSTLPDFVVRSRRVVLPAGIRPAAVHIHRGKIIGIMEFNDVPSDCPLDDAAALTMMPGVVDTHVHASGTGRTVSESFEAATRAAAAGGVTTIVDMPIDSVPTTSVDIFNAKCRAAENHSFVDVGFWGGVVPGNAAELPSLFAAGVRGFKCVLASSEAHDFPPMSEADLRIAMPVLSKIGSPLLVHAELSGPIEAATRRLLDGHGWMSRMLGTAPDTRNYSTYLVTRPKAAENAAIVLLTGLCREYRTRTHIVHLSASDALTPLYHARASGLPITAETCPHYLFFVADEIPDGATAFTCAPPIRERENREYLWAALAGGLIQMVVSDHVMPGESRVARAGDFLQAPAGMSSLPVSLAATWTEASGRGYSLNQVADWMCRAPARLAGLGRKGAIDVGFDADLVIWNPDAEFTVDSRAAPYDGRRLRGVVERTYLRGRCVYESGKPMTDPRGRLLSG